MPAFSQLTILCPTCKTGCLAPESMTESEIRCAACSAFFPVRDGIIDLLPEHKHRRSLSQAVMEWEPFIRIYESKWFRKGPGFPLISGISFDEECEMITQSAKLENDGIVLDLGCGTGLYTRLFAEKVDRGVVVGLDLSAPMLTYAVSRAQARGIQNSIFLRGDAAHLPFPDDQFDVVNCCATIHLFDISALLRMLREVRRVLKTQGRFMTACLRNWMSGTFSKRALSWYSAKVGTYYRRPDEVEALFRQAGLDDVVCLHAKRYWMVMSAIKRG